MKLRARLVCISWLIIAAVGCGQQARKDTPAWVGAQVPDAGSAADSSAAGRSAPAVGVEPVASKSAAAGGGGPSAPAAGPQAGAPAQPPAAGDPQTGSAIAITPDDSLALVVNRDVGSLSVLALSYDKELLTQLVLRKELQLGPGSEPYQVVVAPDGGSAYVILRRDQELLKIGALSGEPAIVQRVRVGSEPTGLALDASGHKAFIANWNDGTLLVVDTDKMQVLRTVDLNAALVATGYLGDIAARPALAHPRSIVVGAAALYVSEFFAQQLEPELPDGTNADTRKVGIVYKVSLPDYTVSTIRLGALRDMGFRDDKNSVAGCYPNQLQSLAINNGYVYALSVCASPEGPLGVKVTSTACMSAADCTGLVEPACVTPFAGAANDVCVDLASVKTTTAPVLSIIDIKQAAEITTSPVSLNARFDALYRMQGSEPAKQRFPLFASEVVFVPGTTVGYVSANGSDAVFRFQTTATGEVMTVGATTNSFIDLIAAGLPADKLGKNPIGMAIAHSHKKVSLVANEVSRNVSALDFNTQAVSGGAMQPLVVGSASLPLAGSDADQVLRGKRFFNTGTARWSLRGQGWGACQSCHADGLSDNVTWYFARGPRQSTSLDGSFASHHPDDQRIFNWTAINDEVADFEANTRGVSGGVGAIVSQVSTPPATSDRIDFQGLGHAALSGSAERAADPGNPLGLPQPAKLKDWSDIQRYMQSIRSPRAPSNLDRALVEAGRALFSDQGKCQGCHGGEKWTVSRRFYTPGTTSNASLNTAPLGLSPDFPGALLPARTNQTLRYNGGNAAAFDQILCVLRAVGTFNVAEESVGVAELRADMTTRAQGDGNPAGEGRGYNVPSLLGVATGAPFLHAGNARSLESLFSDTFAQHHQALAANFLTETNSGERAQLIAALVQYLLSIDEDTAYPTLPGTGASGGALCPQSF